MEESQKYTRAWEKARELVGSAPLDSQELQEMEAAVYNASKNEEDDENVPREESPREEEDIEMKVEDQAESNISAPLSILPEQPWLDSEDHMEVDVSDTDSLFSDDEMVDAFTNDAATKQGIDIHHLTQILDQGRAATADINKTSDVVLVLGGTGVGKSTFIQAMSGKKLVLGWDETLNKSSFVVDGGEDELNGFEIGHGLQSRTRHVRSFFREGSSTFYVDSSGFGDSKAIETDIATSICIRDIGQRAGRLRFVVLINANQFFSDRADELKRRLKVVANIIGDNFSEHRRSFTFTHCNNAFEGTRDLLRVAQEKPGGIPKEKILESMKMILLTLLSETMHATYDRPTQYLVLFLKKSLEKGLPFCDVFDPSLSDVTTIRAKVEPSSVDCKMVLNQPNKHVKCSLTFASLHSIQHEVKYRQQGIITKLQEPTTLSDKDTKACISQDVGSICSLSAHLGSSGAEWLTELQTNLTRASAGVGDVVHKNVQEALTKHMVDIHTVQTVKTSIDNMFFVHELLAKTRGSPTENDHTGNEGYANLVSLLQDQAHAAERAMEQLTVFLCKGHGIRPCLADVAVNMRNLGVWGTVFRGVSEFLGNTKTQVGESLIAVAESQGEDCDQSVRTVAVLKEIHQSKLAKYCCEQAAAFDFEQAYKLALSKTKETLINKTRELQREELASARAL